MTDNYAKIVRDNLDRLYKDLPQDLSKNLPARQDGEQFCLTAFGQECFIAPEGIKIGQTDHASILGILISLYALNASPDACVLTPFKSFKEFPNSMPYVGAFATHTEQVLVPHVNDIKHSIPKILNKLAGMDAPAGTGGDFAFVVYPLPKIALCYIFYEEDEDFPASVTCLYSSNAQKFVSLDGLADVGEYCSKKIIELVS